METLSVVCVTLLALVALRRCAFVAAALLPDRRRPNPQPPASGVAIAVAVRNEEESLPGLLAALRGLLEESPGVRLVLVDDASADGTTALVRDFAAAEPRCTALVLAENAGKAEALNRAVAAAPEAGFIAVYDADMRPQPGSLALLAAACAAPGAGCACGYRHPANAFDSMASRYAALEAWVHQLITQTAKDRLGMNPTSLGGNCVYRREALLAVGGFRRGSLSEDIEISLAVVRAGWRTVFVESAWAETRVAASVRQFWKQRNRWQRGLFASGKHATGPESLALAAGYLDRALLLAVLGLIIAGSVSVWWLALYAAPAAAAVVVALLRAKLSPSQAALVLAALPFFAVDVLNTLASTVNAILRRPVRWRDR
ncbi:MAG: glycosyltransferase family 2 protein [Bryobacterales bacterium]|nr:glycosyltransferase family 2 protein [Bryobacterales bacterium]